MSRAASSRSIERSFFFAPVLETCDAVRRRVLMVLGPAARSILVHRERRVVWIGCTGILSSLFLALFAPELTLAIGPLAFGVPHLVSDGRYLVARPTLHRRPTAVMALLLLVGGLVFQFGVRASLGTVVFAAMVSAGSLVLRSGIAVVAALLLACAQRAPYEADVVFAHAHNLFAVFLWLAWRERAGRLHALVPALFVSASLLLALSPLPTWTATSNDSLSLAHLSRGLSWSENADVTRRLIQYFAFAQSVHYLVWLRLIPEEARPLGNPRSFTQTMRAVQNDLGGTTLWISFAVFFGLIVCACFNVYMARYAYLGIAYAHGHIELVAATFLLTEKYAGARDSSTEIHE